MRKNDRRNPKRLSLNRETVRLMSQGELKGVEVAGGGRTRSVCQASLCDPGQNTVPLCD